MTTLFEQRNTILFWDKRCAYATACARIVFHLPPSANATPCHMYKNREHDGSCSRNYRAIEGFVYRPSARTIPFPSDPRRRSTQGRFDPPLA